MSEPTDPVPAETLSDFLARVRETRLADERYAVVRVLGRGGAGVVVEVRDRLLDRVVAVKQLKGGPDPDVARFVREARITARLDHPNIVPVHDISVDRHGNLSIAMKRIEGLSLSLVLRQGGLPSTAERLDVLRKVCDAVAFAHSRGIFHRDIKPGNVVVGPFGEVFLVDWGLACEREGAEHTAPSPGTEPTPRALDAHTAHGAVQGTPGYMAPGQARGDPAQGPWLDVFGLGALMFFLLLERAPRSGGPDQMVYEAATQGVVLPARHPRLDADLRAVLARAMAFDRRHRYPDVAALRADLDLIGQGFPVGARTVGVWERTRRWLGRHQRSVRRGALLGLLIGVLGAAGLLRYVQDLGAARDVADLRAAEALVGEGRATWVAGDAAGALGLVEEARQRFGALGADDAPARLVQAAIAAETLLPELRVFPAEGPWLASLSGGGDALVSLGKKGTLEAWQIPDGLPLGARQLPPAEIASVEVVGGQPGAVVVADGWLRWRPLSGADRETELGGPAAALVVGPGATAVLGLDGRVQVWRLPDLRPVGRGLEGVADLVAVSGDGQRVVVRPADDEMAKGGTPYELRAAADGALLGTAPWSNGNADDALKLWAGIERAGQGVVLRTMDDSAESVSLRLEGTRWAILGGRGDRALVWTATERLQTWTRSEDGWTEGPRLRATLPRQILDVDGAGQRVVAGTGDGALGVWNTAGHLPMSRLQIPEGSGTPMSVSASPDGQLLAVPTLDGAVHLFDRTTGRLLERLPTSPAGTRQVAFSADGLLLATADRDGQSRVFDVASGTQTWRLEGPDGLAVSVAWQGDVLWQSTAAGSVLRGQAGGHERVTEMEGGAWQVLPLEDGRVAWTCKGDCAQLSAWDGAQVRTLVQGDRQNSFALCELDGDLVYGLGSGQLRVFDGRQSRDIAMVEGPATTCAARGDLLAVGGTDGWLTVLRRGTWAPLGRLQVSASHVAGIAFSDDQTLVAMSSDGTGRVYDLGLFDALEGGPLARAGGAARTPGAADLARRCTARGDWDCAAALGGPASVARVAILAAAGRPEQALALARGLSGPTAAVWVRALGAGSHGHKER